MSRSESELVEGSAGEVAGSPEAAGPPDAAGSPDATQPDAAPPPDAAALDAAALLDAADRVHVGAQRPPPESKYKTLEIRSFEVNAEDARAAATRKIERSEVQRYIDQHGLGGALPSSRPKAPASLPPASLPPAASESYVWLWAAVLVGAVVVGVLVGLALRS